MKAPSKWILLTELTGGDLWQMFSGPVGGAGTGDGNVDISNGTGMGHSYPAYGRGVVQQDGHGNGKGDNAYEHTFGLAVHYFDEREA